MSDATLQLGDLRGVWRPVYARRLALHATADAVVLTAWKADLRGIGLGPAVAAWRQTVGETSDPLGPHRRRAAAAAVLACLTAWSWPRTRKALAGAAQRAHRAGWAAGHHLITRDHTDDTGYGEPGPGHLALGSPDMSPDTAGATATAVLTAALGAAATRAGRAMADSSGDPQHDAEDVLNIGLDLALAADVAVSAAYGAGLLAAYVGGDTRAVIWLSAGDGRVCERCSGAEAGGPYSLLAAPRLPQHPHCRCVLAPA
ncbi:hypothetical protein [Streptomyces sp. NPDC002537]